MSMPSRRDFLKASVFSAATPPLISSLEAQVSEPDASYADSEAANRWMTEWFRSRSVAGALVLSRFADPIYIVMAPINWTPNPPQRSAYKAVSVPVGFVSDLASIPRMFWSAFRPDGDYCYAAIIHDYLYWEQSLSRSMADDIFRFAMEDFRVNPTTIAAIHKTVQLGGGSAWETNTRLKAAGEKRLLKRFPDDPTARWADWKKINDVF